jgi:curved DNA-binding protein
VKAYQVLSDPGKRAAYDDDHKSADAQQEGIFFNDSQLRDDPISERRINQVILLIFYRARKKDSMKPGMGIVDLERLIGLPGKELEFHIWYLREKGWIQRLDSGELAVTASGVDQVVENDLELRKDRLISLKIARDL